MKPSATALLLCVSACLSGCEEDHGGKALAEQRRICGRDAREYLASQKRERQSAIITATYGYNESLSTCLFDEVAIDTATYSKAIVDLATNRILALTVRPIASSLITAEHMKEREKFDRDEKRLFPLGKEEASLNLETIPPGPASPKP